MMMGSRYVRQELLPRLGREGQARLRAARVLLIGCGALGTNIAEHLVRSGVGELRVVDRDVVELSNLHRQVLFTESDARNGTPKAVAAVRRLGEINSEVRLEAQVCHVDSTNVAKLLDTAGDQRTDVILDGTDNVGTRFLINDVAMKCSIPWVYGACVGTEGRVMSVWPGVTACLRCVFSEPHQPGELPTCDTAGVLGPPAAVVGALQAMAAIRLLVRADDVGELLRLNVWPPELLRISTVAALRPDCPTCGLRNFEYLNALPDAHVQLCGRDAVQISPPRRAPVSLESVRRRLSGVEQGSSRLTEHLLRVCLGGDPPLECTLFADGRAVVKGTTDFGRARAIYDRVVGS